MKEKLLQFDGKKWLKLEKTNLVAMATDKPLYFVVVGSLTAIIRRSISVLLLNATNSKNQIFLQNMPRQAKYQKCEKAPKLHCCQHNLNQNYQN